MVSMHMQLFGGEITEIGESGFAMPEVQAKFDGSELPYRLQMTVAVVHGQPICTELTAERLPDGPPVTRRGLNALPLDLLVRWVAAQAAWKITRKPGVVSYDGPSEEGARAVLAELTPRRGRHSDPAAREELIRKVVTAYRDLLASGIRQPKPAIARKLSISPSYVGTLLAEARRQGLLGAAIPGRAGESPDA
jgi:hypothetical protein